MTIVQRRTVRALVALMTLFALMSVPAAGQASEPESPAQPGAAEVSSDPVEETIECKDNPTYPDGMGGYEDRSECDTLTKDRQSRGCEVEHSDDPAGSWIDTLTVRGCGLDCPPPTAALASTDPQDTAFASSAEMPKLVQKIKLVGSDAKAGQRLAMFLTMSNDEWVYRDPSGLMWTNTRGDAKITVVALPDDPEACPNPDAPPVPVQRISLRLRVWHGGSDVTNATVEVNEVAQGVGSLRLLTPATMVVTGDPLTLVQQVADGTVWVKGRQYQLYATDSEWIDYSGG